MRDGRTAAWHVLSDLNETATRHDLAPLNEMLRQTLQDALSRPPGTTRVRCPSPQPRRGRRAHSGS